MVDIERDELGVETRGVVKTYAQGEASVHALRGVDLGIKRGSFVAIMGPSGSGKSTLLHAIGGLEELTSGEITLAGRRIDGMKGRELARMRRDSIGFVFQFFNLVGTLTARENVMLPALMAGVRGAECRSDADSILESVGLGDRSGHRPSEMSGGQQQRVCVARALMRKPPLILADEPTGNLDSKSGPQILDLLRLAVDDESRTVVMVTHDPGAASVADRVIFLRDGSVVGDEVGADRIRIAAYLAEMESAA